MNTSANFGAMAGKKKPKGKPMSKGRQAMRMEREPEMPKKKSKK